VSIAILRGDARALPLPDESVDLIVTSPPYWRQRVYTDGGAPLAGQLGAEDDPLAYIAALVACTREMARVLKPSGSLFINLGDKHSDRSDGGPSSAESGRGDRAGCLPPGRSTTSLAPRTSLLALPERYTIACLDAGLLLRDRIAWYKPNPMPESVTSRCAHTWEYLLHFTLRPDHYSAIDEIREPHTMRPQRRPNGHKSRQQLGVLPAQTHSTSYRDELGVDGHPLGRAPRDVWEIPTQPLVLPDWLAHGTCCDGMPQPGCEGLGHYAAFPFELARRAILGWSPGGICTDCGAGRRPITAISYDTQGRTTNGPRSTARRHEAPGRDVRAIRSAQITGYACNCAEPTAAVRPAVVADPFGGTGTVALAAHVLGRDAYHFDLSADYLRIARWRTTDPGERARAMQVPKPPPVPDGQGDLFAGMEAS
jgi:DNA modification methylase